MNTKAEHHIHRRRVGGLDYRLLATPPESQPADLPLTPRIPPDLTVWPLMNCRQH